MGQAICLIVTASKSWSYILSGYWYRINMKVTYGQGMFYIPVGCG